MPRKKHYQWTGEHEEGYSAPLPPSRSEKKRRSLALQSLGEELTRLGPQALKNLDLPPDLTEALALYARLRDHEGRRRQLQFIGRLMRDLDPEPIRAALDMDKEGSAAATAALHTAEQWRDRLLCAPEDQTPAVLNDMWAALAAPENAAPQAAAGGTLPGPDALRELVDKARHEKHSGRAPHAQRALFRAVYGLLTARRQAT